MQIEIKNLSPELMDDYLTFFEQDAHQGIDEDVRCYCVGWCSENQTGIDLSLADKRKEYALQYSTNDTLHGYLAYENHRVVGWCNTNKKRNCQQCHGWQYALASVKPEAPNQNEKIKSVFCFVVVPDRRGKGIATRLLNRVCLDAGGWIYGC